MNLKFFDYFVIIIYITVIIFSAKFVFAATGETSEVIIENRENKWVYPIDIDQHLYIQGSLGITEVEIKNNEVFILSSPCKNKLCIAKGHIDHSGEWLACLPNGIFIRVNGNRTKKEVDALSF